MMKMNMSMPKEYFVFSEHIKHFLFEDLHINSTTGVVVACLIVAVFTLLLEGGKSLMLYLQLRMKQNPLTYGRSSTSIQTDRIQYHVAGYFLHTVNLIVSYLLMLAVMSYNGYVIIAVVIGSGIGHYIFGAVNHWNQAKFALLRSNIYERYDSRVALATDPPMEEIQ